MALPKKKQAKSGYCAPCCGIFCLAISILLICLGTMIPKMLNNKIQEAIYKGGIADPAVKNYTHWQKDNRGEHGAEVYLSYHFFNVTNPAEVMNGLAPKVVKLGPYVFRKFVTEGKVQYFDGYTKRASRKHGEMKFVPARSTGKLSDVIYMDNVLANWFWTGCTGQMANNFAGKTWPPLLPQLMICTKIAQNGIFMKHRIDEILFGFKMWGFMPFRYNNGHQVCPSNMAICHQGWMQHFYNPYVGDCSAPKKCGGHWSPNWAANKIKEVVTETGYGNAGCMKPLDNQGCLVQDGCLNDGFDKEDEDHNTICSKGMQVGITAMNNAGKPGGAVFNSGGPSQPHKHPAPLTGFDYNSFDATQLKAWFTNVYKWYDETPYDTTDDLATETSILQDGGHPCKWDGSTNGKTGCPTYHKVHGHGQVSQGLFYPPRQAKEDFTVFDNVFFRRPVTMKFEGVKEVHSAKTHKYTLAPGTFTADGANKKYGMDSGANFWQFAGAGSFPMRRVEMSLPISFTLPHWHRGGEISDKWNEALGLRKGMAKDDMHFYYEPITGAPFDMKLHIQQNMMWQEKSAGFKIVNASNTAQVLYDFSNLDLSAHGLGTVDLTKLGKWMSAVDSTRCTGSTGCHSMHPTWSMQLKVEFSPHLTAKLRNLVFGLSKLVGLQKMLGSLVVFGSISIVMTFGCLGWKYFGPKEDKSSALKAAA